jgi:hypothetical protein
VVLTRPVVDSNYRWQRRICLCEKQLIDPEFEKTQRWKGEHQAEVEAKVKGGWNILKSVNDRLGEQFKLRWVAPSHAS